MVLGENENEHLADSSTLVVALFEVPVPFLGSLEGEGAVKASPQFYRCCLESLCRKAVCKIYCNDWRICGR